MSAIFRGPLKAHQEVLGLLIMIEHHFVRFTPDARAPQMTWGLEKKSALFSRSQQAGSAPQAAQSASKIADLSIIEAHLSRELATHDT